MPNHVVNVGNVELISLNDNLPIRSPFVAFPHTTIEEWNEYPEPVSYTHLTLPTNREV